MCANSIPWKEKENLKSALLVICSLQLQWKFVWTRKGYLSIALDRKLLIKCVEQETKCKIPQGQRPGGSFPWYFKDILLFFSLATYFVETSNFFLWKFLGADPVISAAFLSAGVVVKNLLLISTVSIISVASAFEEDVCDLGPWCWNTP